MTISVAGKLRIMRRNGIYGPYSTGDLETDIGDFRVKDTTLDQFDEGLYEGIFWIQKIFPSSYVASGRMIIEVRAKLADMQIDGQGRSCGESREPKEPDPAFEAPQPVAAPAPAPVAEANPASASKLIPATPSETETADRNLFGDELSVLVIAREPVKLDPSIDRLQFRQQRCRLKEELGYIFVAAEQTWFPPGHPKLS